MKRGCILQVVITVLFLFPSFLFAHTGDGPCKIPANFYIWKLFLPMMLIVFMSWAVFWIDPEQIGPRISLSLISMLNIIAYNFAISTFIPRISYLTLADKYIMGCLIIVFFALVEGIGSSTLAAHGKEALAKRIDKISRWAVPASFLLLTGFAFAM